MRLLLTASIFILYSKLLIAVEIEGKDGRKFEANIISADDSEVIVEKYSDSNTFTLKRINLSQETNAIIEQFRNRKKEIDLTSEGYTKVSFPSDKNEVMWLKLPEKNIEIVGEKGLGYVNFISKNSNTLTVKVIRRSKLENAEKVINNAKEQRRKTTHSKATSKEMAEFHKLNNIERIKFGSWDGYYIRHNQGGLIEAAVINGDNMVHTWVDQNAQEKKSTFNIKNFPEIIGSIVLAQEKKEE